MARAILLHRDLGGLWYGDFYFPYITYKGKETLQSPITGKPLSNKHDLPDGDLAMAHITWLENQDVEIKSLPLWLTYVEAKTRYGEIPYQTFMQDHLEEWANLGYSETLLQLPCGV
jgi:hypothetical protein